MRLDLLGHRQCRRVSNGRTATVASAQRRNFDTSPRPSFALNTGAESWVYIPACKDCAPADRLRRRDAATMPCAACWSSASRKNDCSIVRTVGASWFANGFAADRTFFCVPSSSSSSSSDAALRFLFVLPLRSQAQSEQRQKISAKDKLSATQHAVTAVRDLCQLKCEPRTHIVYVCLCVRASMAYSDCQGG